MGEREREREREREAKKAESAHGMPRNSEEKKKTNKPKMHRVRRQM